MKFGKRFVQAIEETDFAISKHEYISYKSLKKALKLDCLELDSLGAQFERTLEAELRKVSEYYDDHEQHLLRRLESHASVPPKLSPEQLSDLHRQVQDLTKFAALNYVAVLKAIKKRNRRLRDACGDQVVTVAPYSVLKHQAFFTSRRLPRITQQAKALHEKTGSNGQPADAGNSGYQCPICLQLLAAPVKLSCMHAFCWGCITMYCLGVLQQSRGADGAGLSMHTAQGSDNAADARGAATPAQGSAAGSDSACSDTAVVTTAQMAQLTQGWAPATDLAQISQFACPACQRKQPLDLDNLTVDHTLAALVRQRGSASTNTLSAAPGGRQSMDISTTTAVSTPSTPRSAADSDAAAMPLAVEAETAPVIPAPPAKPAELSVSSASSEYSSAEIEPTPDSQQALLPPPGLEHKGKLHIVLDIDGTLIASFPPRRAPQLPPHVRTHLVAEGSSLNPQGVFVVERPGLQEFLRRAAALGELSVFTAGLPEYALPIVAAIDPTGTIFGGRIICRGGTSAAPEYPCVKDLSRLGRNLQRTLLVDDTPLAFLWQPANGVPVLGFRGDPDDDLLLDAVLPLLDMARKAGDVRSFIDNRFGMSAWFTSHGYTTTAPAAAPSSRPVKSVAEAPPPASGPAEAVTAVREAVLARSMAAGIAAGTPLLLCDFDKTLVDFDVTERITEQLAIELKPAVQNIEPPADFVAVMNSVLKEMERRGVAYDALCAALRACGAEFAPELAAALRAVRARGVATRVLSNSNSMFVQGVLEGAGLDGVMQDIITHEAEVHNAAHASAPAITASHATGSSTSSSNDADALLQRGSQDGTAGTAAQGQPSWTVEVSPLQPPARAHTCPLCPPSLCKGMHVDALIAHHEPRVVFCGDGGNDVCAVLRLRPQDVALVREGHSCCKLLRARARDVDEMQQPACTVRYWRSHGELAKMIMTADSLRKP